MAQTLQQYRPVDLNVSCLCHFSALGISPFSQIHRPQIGPFFVKIYRLSKTPQKGGTLVRDLEQKGPMTGPRCVEARFRLPLGSGLGRFRAKTGSTGRELGQLADFDEVGGDLRLSTSPSRGGLLVNWSRRGGGGVPDPGTPAKSSVWRIEDNWPSRHTSSGPTSRYG